MKIFSTWWNIFFLHDKMFLMMFNLHATLWMRWGKETVARLRPYPIQIFRTKRVKESEYDSFHYQKAFIVIFENIKLWLTKVWFNLFPCFVQGNIILYPCTVFITKSQKIMKFDEFHVKSSNSSKLNIYKSVPDSMKIVRINQK